VLVKLRRDAVKAKPHKAEDAIFQAAATAMSGRRRWTAALNSAKAIRFIRHTAPPPLSRWTRTRDLPNPPAEPFRTWWKKRHK
jgi:L-lactate dehydrogenase complex protein LldF